MIQPKTTGLIKMVSIGEFKFENHYWSKLTQRNSSHLEKKIFKIPKTSVEISCGIGGLKLNILEGMCRYIWHRAKTFQKKEQHANCRMWSWLYLDLELLWIIINNTYYQEIQWENVCLSVWAHLGYYLLISDNSSYDSLHWCVVSLMNICWKV